MYQHQEYLPTNFQANIFSFWLWSGVAQKPGKGNDITMKRILWRFLLSYVKANGIFKILKEKWTRWHVLRALVMACALDSILQGIQMDACGIGGARVLLLQGMYPRGGGHGAMAAPSGKIKQNFVIKIRKNELVPTQKMVRQIRGVFIFLVAVPWARIRLGPSWTKFWLRACSEPRETGEGARNN